VFFAHSTVIYNAEKAGLIPAALARSWPWWALKVFLTKQGLDFLAMAFLWLTWRECNAAWASVYYLPLLYMTGVLLLGNVLPAKRRARRDGGRGAAAAAAGGGAHAAAGRQQAAGEGGQGGAGEGEQGGGGGSRGVQGDHLHLGEGFKAALVPSRPSSRPDLTNGMKEE
jgi:hypothetical protein